MLLATTAMLVAMFAMVTVMCMATATVMMTAWSS